jgi:hypothetical protein
MIKFNQGVSYRIFVSERMLLFIKPLTLPHITLLKIAVPVISPNIREDNGSA